jgi:hypothetical protein
LVALFLAGTPRLGAEPRRAQDSALPSRDGAAATAESVMVPLQRTLAWYRDARAAMQSIRSVLDTDVDRGEVEIAHRVLQRAFDLARARAAILAEDRSGSPTTPSRDTRADRRA